MFDHQIKLKASAFIKGMLECVSCNSFMTYSRLNRRTTSPQLHKMHPSSTLFASFLLKNGNNSAVHLLGHLFKIQCKTLAIPWLSLCHFLSLFSGCRALIAPLSIVSMRFTMSSWTSVFFGALGHFPCLIYV